jgi:hypothetical protein
LDGYEQRPCRCGAKNCCGYIVDKAYRTQIVTLMDPDSPQCEGSRA